MPLASPTPAQPFKDLGTVTASILVSGGPRTLYTPATGEFVCLLYASGVNCDRGRISFGPYSDNINSTGLYWSTSGTSQDGLFEASSDVYPARYFPGAPVVARWGTTYSGAGFVLLGAAGTWQANHAYTVGQGIIDAGGHVQIVSVAGTSGGTIPAFPDDGNDTTDNTVTWADNNLAPTAGSVHVVALRGVPS